MHAVGDGGAHVEPEPRYQVLGPLWALWHRHWLVEEEAARGDLLLGCGRRLLLHDVPPLRAPGRAAAAAARALRVAERQAHLEGEVGAQEIGEVGAVGLDHELLLVLTQAQMVEQEIASGIA